MALKGVKVSGGLQFFQYIFRKGKGVDRIEHLFDNSLGVNEIGDALGAFGRGVFGGTVGDDGLHGRVTEQIEVEPLFAVELFVGLNPIVTHAEDDHVVLLKFLDSIPEPLSLHHSARGIRPRVEPEQNTFANEIGQFSVFAEVIFK